MSDGFSVDLDAFQQALHDHVDPAVAHFSAGADQLRPIQTIHTGELTGADPASLHGAFAMQADGMQFLISKAHDQLRDSLKGLSDALWEVYRTYSATEQQHVSRLDSIGRN